MFAVIVIRGKPRKLIRKVAVYYSSPYGADGFLPYQVGAYDRYMVSGMLNGCAFEHVDYNGVIWLPNVDPNSAGYYVNDYAEFNAGTITIESQVPGCTP